MTFHQQLAERFEFRNILPEEADQAVLIEQICFPPNEACTEARMKERVAVLQELFLVAVDKENGKIAGFLNGVSTNEAVFRDEFFTDITLYDPAGVNVMLMGLDVLPEYRGQGLAREIVRQYAAREQEKGRKALFLTCLDAKVSMYEKFGFKDHGIANSTWGGEEWHEMSMQLLPMPKGLSKKEIMESLLREEYGYLPEKPYHVEAEQVAMDPSFCAGGADLVTLKLKCKAAWGEFAFPIYYVCPKKAQKPVPAFIHINFTNRIPDKYQPTEEIIDSGFAVLTIYYEDVTKDDGDFTNGLAGVVYPDGIRKKDQCGKIGLWAWAAMAVMEYALTLPELDSARISVIGHSRLGKTALLAGALEERFYSAISNNSGCSGAAISRNKGGESIKAIYTKFPYWFCENYEKYMEKEGELPFDQHYLIAANVPHRVIVGSAERDLWAGPKNEYLSCVAASDYFKEQGLTGLISEKTEPEAGDFFPEGHICYWMRSGGHYLGRADWAKYIEYLNQSWK